MSSTNRRFIVAYVVLVGIPLAALAGVLKIGRGLTAPISIDGTWKTEAKAVPASQPCNQAISSLLDSPLVISQSGKTLELSLKTGAAKITVPGALEGTKIEASLGSAAGCPADQLVTLVASVNPKAEPRSLTGSLSVTNCAACAVEFRAVRQPKTQSGGAH